MQFWMSCERETELWKRHFWECPGLRDGTFDSPFQSEGVRVGRREGLRLQLHLNRLITNPNDQGQRTMTFYCITSTLTVSKNRVQRSFKRWMHFAQCSRVSNFIRNRANYSRPKSGRNLPFCGETHVHTLNSETTAEPENSWFLLSIKGKEKRFFFFNYFCLARSCNLRRKRQQNPPILISYLSATV